MNRSTTIQYEIVSVGRLEPFSIYYANGFIGIREDYVYIKYANWSSNFIAEMFESIIQRPIAFYSGSGKFMKSGPVLIDTITDEIIAILVKNSDSGNLMYLVSDRLDTPKCPRKYKSLRAHWRKGLFIRLEMNRNSSVDNIKIVKTDHKFLQNFLIKFNYNPNAKEISKLKHDIYSRVISKLE